MWTYWHGDGKLIRVSIVLPPVKVVSSDLPQAIAAYLGFPIILDSSNRVEDGDEVLVYGPREAGTVQTLPGRDDLPTESLAVWLRGRTVTGIFFAKNIGDLVAILSMIAGYEKALCDITEYGERFVEIRARHAQDAEPAGRPGQRGAAWTR